MTVQITSV